MALHFYLITNSTELDRHPIPQILSLRPVVRLLSPNLTQVERSVKRSGCQNIGKARFMYRPLFNQS